MNDEEAQKHRLIGAFGRAAPTYDQIGPSFFAEFGRRLVEFAHLDEGARVLDVATGTGAVLFPAAERIGPQGRITGIDLSETMVEATANKIVRQGLTNAEVLCMDAEDLTFADATFDYVLCGLSLFLFPRLSQVLANFRRVSRPKGKIAVSTFMSQDEPSKRMSQLLQRYGAEFKLMFHSLRTRDELESHFSDAGLHLLDIAGEEADFVYVDGEQWWAMHWSHGLRGPLETMSPDKLASLKADALEMMKEFTDSAGLHHSRRVQYAIAIASE